MDSWKKTGEEIGLAKLTNFHRVDLRPVEANVL